MYKCLVDKLKQNYKIFTCRIASSNIRRVLQLYSSVAMWNYEIKDEILLFCNTDKSFFRRLLDTVLGASIGKKMTASNAKEKRQQVTSRKL